jgi:hypothetical protein
VIPRSRGGPTSPDNLVLQCPHCSLRKADKIAAADPETGRMVALFHPLHDVWHEHFRLDPDGTCCGLTPTGRATVRALAMNARVVCFARLCQLKLGLTSPID